jgi:serine phosphatase RsbU (regulator of sigma subunit)/Tfp pilus assembly protein PilF
MSLNKFVNSQNTVIDSLTNLLATTEIDTSKINILNLLSLKLVGSDLEKASEYSNQAITLSIQSSYKEGLALAYKNLGIINFYQGNLEKAIENSTLSAETYKIINNKDGEARAYMNIGIFYKTLGNYDKALEYYITSTETFTNSDDKSGLALSYTNTATVYQLQGNYQQALSQYLEALKIQEELDDKTQIAAIYNNIALIYKIQKNFESATNNFNKALKIYVQLEDNKNIAEIYVNIGTVFYENGDNDIKNYDSAIVFYNKSLELFSSLGLSSKIALLNYNLGDAYNKINKIEEAKTYLENSLKLYIELEEPTGIILSHSGLGENYFLRKDFKNAITELEQALVPANELGAIYLRDINEYLSQSYYAIGQYKEAYESHVVFKQMHDSIFRSENERTLTQLTMQYEFDKKEKEQQIIHEAEIRQQKLVNIFTLFGLALVILLAFFVYRSYRIKSKANIALQLKNEEIMQQKEEIQTQRDEIEEQKDEIENQRDIAVKQKEEIQFQKKEIEDSIHYAKRIQSAVLPARDMLVNTFIQDNFIVFKPRDIVSGDFYWATQKSEELIVAAADCTGHGVPGAFMSMLGVAYLNEIVNRGQKLLTNEILSQLRSHIIASLHQTGKELENKDGMDIALCIINNDKQTIQYSGAYNPMYLVRKKDKELPEMDPDTYVIFESDDITNQLIEIKADRMPIGIHVKTEKQFKNHKFKIIKDDTIYLFSDGFADQFGGKDDRKYTYKQFKNMFLKVQNLNMIDQRYKILEELEIWQGTRKQLDDILILGIKI